MLDEDKVRHVAKLARIELKDADVKKFTSQLSAVFEYMDILNEVDVSKVKETNQVTGLLNVMEKDDGVASQSTREELLGCTELPVDSKQVRVMNIIK